MFAVNVVPSVDNFEVPKLDKVGVFGVPDGDDGVHLLDQLLLLLSLEVVVPFGQPGLAGPVLQISRALLHIWTSVEREFP